MRRIERNRLGGRWIALNGRARLGFPWRHFTRISFTE